MVAQVEDGSLDLGAPIMGLQGSSGEVLAGDPIPDAPGANAGTNYGDENHSAIVDDENLWDHLIIEPEVITIEEEVEGSGPATPETPSTPSTEQEAGIIVLPEEPSGNSESEDVDFVEETVNNQNEEESNGTGSV